MTSSLLVDTSSLTYRAFFALPTSITGEDGRPVNAVRGYLDMVAAVVAETRPDQVLHCWDDAEVPEGRLAAYPAYKADRSAPPEGIVEQFGLLRRLLPAMGEAIVEAPGWEADDAIGTLCADAGPEDRIEVLTGDRDLIQLVRDPVVRVRYTLSGTKRVRVYDEAVVLETFGVPAHRYVDFAILRGDPSDGLPGIPGVGPKTAVRLIESSPDLDALLADVDGHPPRLGRTLREHAGYIAAMQQVVPVQRSVQLRHVARDADPRAVAAMVSRHRLSGSAERWAAARGQAGAGEA